MKKIVFYLPLFFPDKERFYQILDIFDKWQVDFVEIGLPAGNPYMDGERIAQAHQRVLQAGYSSKEYLTALSEICEKYRFQVVLMGYYQDFLRFPEFFMDETEMHFDAMLCVDLPKEVGSRKNIPVLNEMDSEEVISEKLRYHPLFAYVMSSLGKTGSGQLRENYKETIHRIKKKNSLPCFVGFQIKTVQDVRKVLDGGADGAIIGSELLKKVEGGLEEGETYIREICEVVHTFPQSSSKQSGT